MTPPKNQEVKEKEIPPRVEDKMDEVVVRNSKTITVDNDNELIATTVTTNFFRLRYGLQLSTPPSATNRDKKIFLATQTFFKIMKAVDKYFTIVPWSEDDDDIPIIRKYQDMPNTTSKFRVYFNRVQFKQEGGTTYPIVYIQ